MRAEIRLAQDMAGRFVWPLRGGPAGVVFFEPDVVGSHRDHGLTRGGILALAATQHQTAAIDVITVSNKPQRYAAAAITKRKNRKKELLWLEVHREISAGHITSAA